MVTKEVTTLFNSTDLQMNEEAFTAMQTFITLNNTPDKQVVFYPAFDFSKEQIVSPNCEPSYLSVLSFLNSRKLRNSASANTYRLELNHFFNYLEKNGITRPVKKDIASYVLFMQEQEGKKNTTCQNYLQAVKQYFKQAKEDGLYPNIAASVEAVSVDKYAENHRALTPAQVKSLLESIDTKTMAGCRNYAIITLMVYCGLRDVEIARATMEDYNTATGVLTVHGKGKAAGGKSRPVTLTKECHEALQIYLKRRTATKGTDPLFAGAGNKNSCNALPAKSISRIVKEALLAIGLNSDKLTAHSLRTTFATLLLSNGIDLKAVQQAMGHSRPETTIIYQNKVKAENNPCFEAMAELLQVGKI